MKCSNCGHAISDESLGFCSECGQPLDPPGGGAGYSGEGDYDPDHAWEAPPPSAAERLEQVLSKAAEPLRSVGGLIGEAFQSVLDHPTLRSLLPGGSLTLLGLALVGLALLLSMVPFIAGIGVVGSGVMLLMGLLVAVNEWRLISLPELQARGSVPLRRLPASLENLPGDTQHPAIAQSYALLTCTYALLMLGTGLVSLVWLLAALMLGYDQGRIYFADMSEASDDPEVGSHGIHPHRWVVLGVVICSFSLLLPWTRGSLQVSGLSGAEQPLSVLTQGSLLLLACSAVRHRGLSGLHPLGLILMGVWLTLWFFLMMSPYAVGPWFYLLGLLVLDGAIVFHFMPRRRGGNPPEELAPDMDSQG